MSDLEIELKELIVNAKTHSEYRSYVEQLNTLYAAETTKFKQGREQGREEGREQGREEGAQNKAIESAKKMLTDNMPDELVARYSGLSIEEVENLKSCRGC